MKLNQFEVVVGCACLIAAGAATARAYEPIQVGFLWHMHQPNYYPYLPITTIQSNGYFTFNVLDIHNQRFGPYTSWPRDAVQAGAGLAHLGAQVSFTGSLIENLNAMRAAGVNGGMWNNWDSAYDQSQSLLTSLGNRRLDMVAFGFHHPLMPLLDEQDIRMQIKLHKHITAQTWTGGSAYSHGMFPAETAFSERIIPALVAEGLEWVLVDNIHFDRACVNYPHTNASCIFAPNRAERQNPDPAASGGAWVQLNNVWAPSRVSAPFGYQPHKVQSVNPATGAVTQMVAVPAARYEGNEDGRGGYGAFLYDAVMDAYITYNNDAAHPMFVVLHHDGDNYGGGTDAYYHSNFNNMINWVSNDPDYDVSTVDDYLDRFPVASNDVIHVEDGSWAGADCGDAEFKKWLGDPNGSGWSPDRNSWAVLTAAKNRVFTAEAIAPVGSMQNVLAGSGSNTEKAWHFLLVSEASDYWYWDGSSEPWDSNVTRGCNQAVTFADPVIAGQPDGVPPTIFLPQREPYNPGGMEWGTSPEPSNFEVWTLVYDVSGLTNVTLKWRTDVDGENPIASIQNETFAGGAEVSAWNSLAMTGAAMPPVQNGVIAATYKASRYAATITGQNNVLIDYYVEAIDGQGNVQTSPIQHVYVGPTSGGGGNPGGGDVVVLEPDPPVAGQGVKIIYDPAGRPLATATQVYLHYGFNTWNPVITPDPAMIWNATDSVWELIVTVQATATKLDFVFNNGAGTWDNNGGADWHFQVEGGTPPAESWTINGQLDAAATLVGTVGSQHLYAGMRGDILYVATEDAGGGGNDQFILVAAPPGALRAAPWAKAGSVANWIAFIGNEGSNAWAGWADASATTQLATGSGSGWLEGTIDLAQEVGSLPATVYVAMAPYTTPDGGTLVSAGQIPPAVLSNGNIEANEYLALSTCTLQVTHAAADLNVDCAVNVGDYNVFANCLSGPNLPPAGACPGGVDADLDNDSDVDLRDFAKLQKAIVAP